MTKQTETPERIWMSEDMANVLSGEPRSRIRNIEFTRAGSPSADDTWIRRLAQRIRHHQMKGYNMYSEDELVATIADEFSKSTSTPATRAHVEGCTKALSVPVDLCECGGRTITWPAPTPATGADDMITRARAAAPHTEESGEVCTDGCQGCNDPVAALIADRNEARAEAFRRGRRIESLEQQLRESRDESPERAGDLQELRDTLDRVESSTVHWHAGLLPREAVDIKRIAAELRARLAPPPSTRERPADLSAVTAAFHRGVNAAKDAIRAESHECENYCPSIFINAIARRCGFDRQPEETNATTDPKP